MQLNLRLAGQRHVSLAAVLVVILGVSLATAASVTTLLH